MKEGVKKSRRVPTICRHVAVQALRVTRTRRSTTLSQLFASFVRFRRSAQTFTLVRSRSSPSPPDGGPVLQRSRAARRRPKPLKSVNGANHTTVDWSTSYQAGSSRFVLQDKANRLLMRFHSSESDNDSSGSGEDEIPPSPAFTNGETFDHPKLPVKRGSQNDDRESVSSGRSSPPIAIRATPSSPAPLRSRSPAVKPLVSPSMSNHAPSSSRHGKLYPQTGQQSCLLPYTFCVSLPLPWGRHVRKVTGDFRKAGENIILLLSLLLGLEKLWNEGHGEYRWLALGALSFELACCTTHNHVLRARRSRRPFNILSDLDTFILFFSPKSTTYS